MEEIRFSVALPADVWLAVYRGAARAVVVRAEDGRTVQIPAHHFRPFVTRAGLYGRFRLRRAGSRLLSLERIA